VAALEDGDRERLKWVGVFFRQTPGQFMMRVRMSNGLRMPPRSDDCRDQPESGPNSPTSRRGSRFSCAVSESIACRTSGASSKPVRLASIQTGMDNIRNVAGTRQSDATRALRRLAGRAAFTDTFMRNKAFTNPQIQHH
jgi:hypothetical protein